MALLFCTVNEVKQQGNLQNTKEGFENGKEK